MPPQFPGLHVNGQSCNLLREKTEDGCASADPRSTACNQSEMMLSRGSSRLSPAVPRGKDGNVSSGQCNDEKQDGDVTE